MAHRQPFSERIAKRIRDLREGQGLSLTELQKRTGDTLSKSRISNWEQGTRSPGPDEAEILASAVSPAHVLCLDDRDLILSVDETELIRAFRTLPFKDRRAYQRRITTLALAYSEAIPDEKAGIKRYASSANRKRVKSK